MFSKIVFNIRFVDFLSTTEILGHSDRIYCFHEEYKNKYPKDNEGYLFLWQCYRESCAMRAFNEMCEWNMKGEMEVIYATVCPYFTCNEMFQQRWWEPTPELFAFLRSGPRIGDIFICNKKKKNYLESTGGGGEWKVYQTMRNSVVHALEMNTGKCYVSVGFVDIQQLLFANIIGKGHVEYHGYDMNPICVARAKLILELLKDPLCSDQEILQIWYSTSINLNAGNAIQEGCKKLD